MKNGHDNLIHDKIIEFIFPGFYKVLANRKESYVVLYGLFQATLIALPALVAVVLQYTLIDKDIVGLLRAPAFLIFFEYLFGWGLSVLAVGRALNVIPSILKQIDQVVDKIDPSNERSSCYVNFMKAVVHNSLPTTLVFLVLILVSAYSWFFNHYLKRYSEVLLAKPLLLASTIFYSTIAFLRTFIWIARIATYIVVGTLTLRKIIRTLKYRIHGVISSMRPTCQPVHVYSVFIRLSFLSRLFRELVDFAVWGSFMWIMGITIIIPLLCLTFAELVPLYYGFVIGVVFYLIGALFHLMPKREFGTLVKYTKMDLAKVVENLEENTIDKLLASDNSAYALIDQMRSYILLQHLRQRLYASIPDVKPSISRYYILSKIPFPVISLLVSSMLKELFTYESITLIELLLNVLEKML